MGSASTPLSRLTAIGPEYYGEGGQHISAQETCLLRMEASGQVRAYVGTSDQGQGIDTGLQQVVAAGLGLRLEDVEIISGDSVLSPMGGGSWGSRGAALGGEVAWKAARTLRAHVLAIAGARLQKDPGELELANGIVRDRGLRRRPDGGGGDRARRDISSPTACRKVYPPT